MEGVEKVVEEADETKLLILRTTSNGLTGNQDEQRENIFHSRQSKGKFAHLSLIVGVVPMLHHQAWWRNSISKP